MLELDIGMNERLCDPLEWDDSRRFDRGKVMTHEMLERGDEFGRYLDVDVDGIPYRTYPGTHPQHGSYFTRGTTKDRYAKYSEAGPDYVDNMQRLLRKFETAKSLVPEPIADTGTHESQFGVIFFGSTAPAMYEAIDALEVRGLDVDALRIRAFPFSDAVTEFILEHDQVFVVEQNRDAQLRMMLINECGANPTKLVAVLHYDGTPITARFIVHEISEGIAALNEAPIRSSGSK